MGKSAPTTTTTSAPPPEIMAAYKQVMDRAAGVADTPYTAYGGNLVAGMSGIGQFGTNMVQDGSAAAQSSYDAASGYAGQGAQAYSPTQVTPTQFSGAALQQYMSPYTQNVIDSTMANINQNNAIQASSLTSNGIQSGNAFGGDRLGVAQAELARGQSMSSDQTIAGLWNQNFAQALGQFNQQQGVDLSAQQFNSTSNATAAQNNAARALQASQLSSGIASGVAGSSLAAGSNLQSYGQQQQATDQAGLTAAYQQWQAAQSFPYAQTQWLSGIQSGLGSLSGGTSQSVGTAPSAMNQVIGGVTAAAGLFSDERVKEDIKEVGKTHDGQKVYTYRYKGLPQTHMGLMAQEVEGDHPEAVGVSGGIKTVDYKAATRDAEVRRASGGGVMPYSGVGFIPQVETKHGAGVGIPTAKAPDAEKAPDFKAAGSAINGLVDGYLDKFGQPSTGETSAVAGASSGMMGGVSFPMFASGGAVARRGVAPRLRGFASGGSAFQDRMDAVADAVANGDFDPQGLNYNEFKGEPAARSVVGRGAADVIPIARAAPADDPVRIDGVYDAGAAPMTEARAAANYNGTGTGAGVGSGSGLPPQITGPANDDLPSNVMAFDRTSRGVAPASSRSGMVDVGTQYERPATEAPQQQSGFGGLFEQAKGLMPHLSENAKTALITAGLSMMASRSPNVGQAIGEGGLAGMNAYAGAQKAEREAAESDAKMANDRTRLGYEGQRVAETSRANSLAERSSPLIFNPKTGSMEVNPAWQKQKEFEKSIAEDKVKPGIIDYNDDGTPVNGFIDSSNKKYYLPGGAEYTPKSVSPAAAPPSALTADSGADKPYNYARGAPTVGKGIDVPPPTTVAGKSPAVIQAEAEYYLQTGLQKSPAPRSSSVNAIQQGNARNAVANYAQALAQSRGISPQESAEMWRSAPNTFKFILGPDGRSTVALGTATRHLDTLEQYIDAYKGNNQPEMRRIGAMIDRQFGGHGATDINSISAIVGPEIVKAIGVAGAGTASERSNFEHMFQGGTDQAKGAITAIKTLLGGQLEGKERQAKEAGVSTDRFKRLIGDEEYNKIKQAGAAHVGADKPAARADTRGAPAVGFVKGGYRFKGGNPADKSNWVAE